MTFVVNKEDYKDVYGIFYVKVEKHIISMITKWLTTDENGILFMERIIGNLLHSLEDNVSGCDPYIPSSNPTRAFVGTYLMGFL